MAMAVAEARAAVPAAETLIPGTARAFVSVRNVKDLETALNKTKFGGIFKEESLKPFVNDVKAQIDARIADAQSSLGLELQDFKDLSHGEVAFTVVDLGTAAEPVFHGSTGTAVLVDVTGHDKELVAVRAKITASLLQKKAVAAKFTAPAGADGQRFDIPPPKEGHPTVVMIEAAHATPAGTLWIVSDSPALVTLISAAFAGQQLPPLGPGAPLTLAESDVFQKILKQTKEADAAPAAEGAAKEPKPLVVGYADPFNLMSALRAYQFPVKKFKPDVLKIAGDSGLTSILGVGGQAIVAHGNLGTLVRVSVITKKPYEKSMKMLEFPVGSDFVPQPWVHHDIVGYTTLFLDPVKAFDNISPIFDGFLEQAGIWDDVITSLETDPDGPQIKLKQDFFELLGNRLTIIVDKKLPPADDSSQVVFALDMKADPNPEVVKATSDKIAETLRKAFTNDPDVQKVEFVLPENKGKLEAWKITSTEQVPPAAANQANVVDGVRVVFTAYVTAYHNHVLIGSNAAAIEKLLIAPEKGLALSPDYVAVTEVIGKFIVSEAKQPIALGFNRSDELFRVDYELFKAGKMAGSQTLLGRLFDVLWAEAEKDGRKFKPLDGSKLPKFEKIQKYLSPTGLVVSNSEDGLFLVGFTLENAPPGPEPKEGTAELPAAAPTEGSTPAPK